jgi:hypothetical protein
MMAMTKLCAAAAPALALCAAAPAMAQPAGGPDILSGDFGPIVKWLHLYSGADGKTHIEVMPVPEAKGPNGMTSLFARKAESFTIGYWPDGFQSDWHYATHLNLLIYLQGTQIIDIGDGQEHRLEPGMAVYAENWTGLGHRFRCIAKTGKKACVVIQATLGDLDRSLPLRER